jgi:HPt (histidine-containing phosphotransfer) domain-containing protein
MMLADNAVSAIDLGTLRLFVGEDDEMAVIEFLGRFFARLDADMQRMRDRIALQRWGEAARLAHQMRSCALAIGASGFALLCAAFEKTAPEADQSQIELDFCEMARSFNEVRRAVALLCLCPNMVQC